MDHSFTAQNGELVEFTCLYGASADSFEGAQAYDDEHQSLVDAYYAEHEEMLHELAYQEGLLRRFSHEEMYS